MKACRLALVAAVVLLVQTPTGAKPPQQPARGVPVNEIHRQDELTAMINLVYGIRIFVQ
jgi:hypothetical protein